VLIVRDPLDRIRSMYDFYRRGRVNDDPLTADAKRLKLPEFLEHLVQTRRHLVTNAQTNVVANAGHKIPDASDLERAAVMVREASAVGLVENYDLCALQAETSLRPFFPGIDLSYIRENVTPLRGGELEARLRRFAGECGQELYKTLLELNRLDMELVKIVKAESLHRWQIMDRQQTTMRSFRRRVQQRRIVDAMSHHILKVRRLFGRALHLLSPEP
jgi:hypothetical protein